MNFLFEKNKADLKRLVANADMRVSEIFEGQMVNENMVPKLAYGYKVRLTDMKPPLRVMF